MPQDISEDRFSMIVGLVSQRSKTEDELAARLRSVLKGRGVSLQRVLTNFNRELGVATVTVVTHDHSTLTADIRFTRRS